MDTPTKAAIFIYKALSLIHKSQRLIQERGCTAQKILPTDTLHCSIILQQETAITQQIFLKIIRNILYVTDITAATSLKMSQDADAGRMQGES